MKKDFRKSINNYIMNKSMNNNQINKIEFKMNNQYLGQLTKL